MTEEELAQKRKEYRDTEVQNKISEYSKADEYRSQTLKAHYTKHKVDKKLPKFAWFLIICQASSLIFFSSLYVFTYIPKTKLIVTKVLP